jgi:hypothetical protein
VASWARFGVTGWPFVAFQIPIMLSLPTVRRNRPSALNDRLCQPLSGRWRIAIVSPVSASQMWTLPVCIWTANRQPSGLNKAVERIANGWWW